MPPKWITAEQILAQVLSDDENFDDLDCDFESESSSGSESDDSDNNMNNAGVVPATVGSGAGSILFSRLVGT